MTSQTPQHQQQPQTSVQKRQADTVYALLERMKPQMALALPKHMNPDRMTRIVLTEIRKNPKLAGCETQSLLGAVMQAAQLGLEPGLLGQCYLVPFRNNRKGITEVQFIIGYKGMVSLARRSGDVIQIQANTVFENDDFDYGYGTDGGLSHRPYLKGDRGDIKCYYAYAKLRDGGEAYVVLSPHDVEKVRSRSKSKDDGPWVTDYEAMAHKSCVRQLFKWLPVSVEVADAIEADHTVRSGIEAEAVSVENPDLEVEAEYETNPADETAPHAESVVSKAVNGRAQHAGDQAGHETPQAPGPKAPQPPRVTAEETVPDRKPASAPKAPSKLASSDTIEYIRSMSKRLSPESRQFLDDAGDAVTEAQADELIAELKGEAPTGEGSGKATPKVRPMAANADPFEV